MQINFQKKQTHFKNPLVQIQCIPVSISQLEFLKFLEVICLKKVTNSL